MSEERNRYNTRTATMTLNEWKVIRAALAAAANQEANPLKSGTIDETLEILEEELRVQ